MTLPSTTHYNLEQALHQLAEEAALEYSIIGKTVLIRPKKDNGHVVQQEPLQTRKVVEPVQESPLRPSDFNVAGLAKKQAFTSPIFTQVAPPPLTLPERPIAIAPPENRQAITTHAVKLGPVYVQPRKPYGLLDEQASLTSKPFRGVGYRPHLTGSVNTVDEQEAVFEYRLFNLSLVPGMGTNGLNPGGYYNGISFNATVDYSAGNNILGVAGFSNFSRYSAYGIQLAGILNLVGGDMYQQKRAAGMSNADLKSPFFGVQVAGVGNLVTGDASGFQGALVNMVGGNSAGWQLGGLSNMSAGSASGAQTSAFFNYSGRSFSGIQFAAVNLTQGELKGWQVGAFNRNQSMNGPKSYAGGTPGWQLGIYNLTGHTEGYQLGLVNMSKGMDGLQFGLVNISKGSGGTHIGLVNIYGDHSGWAYGLVNIGPKVMARVWANETFQANVGVVTGSEKVSNVFFYSRNVLLPNAAKFWARQAWGYGISKGNVFHPNDLQELRFTDLRINLSWVNFEGLKKQPFNLLVNPHLVWGSKIARDNYFTLGAGLNAWWAPIGGAYQLSYLEVASFNDVGYAWKFWPSVKIGLEFLN